MSINSEGKKSSKGIKASRKRGEEVRRALIDMDALDPHLKIKSDGEYVYVPVRALNDGDLKALEGHGDLELLEMEFSEDIRRLTPEEVLGFRPSYEVIGDIAVVDGHRAEEVAKVLMSLYKNVKTVITPVSEVEGEFRTRRFGHVAGEARTVTVHKEHGLRYRVDLEGAYFTQRLGTERLRIARQVAAGQYVLDMFAGVGPFALLLAKRGARVVAIEKNPLAVSYLLENAHLNKVDVEIVQGDAADITPRYADMADHVIMNLPHSASKFLPQAMTAARDKGTVHYYAMAPEEDLYRDRTIVERVAKGLGIGFEVTYQGVVRSYSPRHFNVVMDFAVLKR